NVGGANWFELLLKFVPKLLLEFHVDGEIKVVALEKNVFVALIVVEFAPIVTTPLPISVIAPELARTAMVPIDKTLPLMSTSALELLAVTLFAVMAPRLTVVPSWMFTLRPMTFH